MIPTPEELEGIVERFAEVNVLVVGDAMLDHTVWGKVDKSPDLPEFRWRLKVDREEHGLGGAANAAANVVSIGAHASLMFAAGLDEAGDQIYAKTKELGIGRYRINEGNRRTVVKQRVYETNGVNPNYIGRLDFDWGMIPVNADTVEILRNRLREFKCDFNAVLIEDYAKGLIVPEVIDLVKDFARDKKIPVIVDPNRVHPCAEYEGVSILKPNRGEASLYLPVQGRQWNQIAYDLSKKLGSQLVLTDGKEGMYVVNKEGELTHIQGISMEGKVIDTVGAGDCVAAVLAACAGLKLDIVASATIANVAAAVAISQGKVCGRPTPESLIKTYHQVYPSLMKR